MIFQLNILSVNGSSHLILITFEKLHFRDINSSVIIGVIIWMCAHALFEIEQRRVDHLVCYAQSEGVSLCMFSTLHCLLLHGQQYKQEVHPLSRTPYANTAACGNDNSPCRPC